MSAYTMYFNQDYSRIRGIEVEYKTRFSQHFNATLSGSYSIATGKSSSSSEAIYNIQQGLDENIKEVPMVFDRPLQLSANLGLITKKDDPLFGFGKGILDNYSAFVRIFYQSGKRYTQANYIGYDVTTGRPYYSTDNSPIYGELGKDWFYIDMNLEKNFTFGIGTFSVSLEVKNILDKKNSQIVNPTTGRAYEYGDPTVYPSGDVNDPKYPDLRSPISPYPYNPARYLNPRTALLGVSYKF